MVLLMHPNAEPLLLSLFHFDLAETGVKGIAKLCHLKQGAHLIKNVVQVDEVQVMWLRHLCYVIQTVKIVLKMDSIMYINAHRKPEETLSNKSYNLQSMVLIAMYAQY